MKTQSQIISLCTLLMFFSSASISNATVVKKLSDENLVTHARTILTGSVTSITSEWNKERTKIYTYITITPRNFLKGDDTQEQLVIKQLGGEVGDIGMRVEGTSVFEKDEEVFLFLKKGPQGFQRVVGLSQGKLYVKTDPDTKRKILVKKRIQRIKTPSGKTAKITLEIKSDKKLFLDEFTNRIRTILQKQEITK